MFRAVLDALGRGALVWGDNLTDVIPYRDAAAGYQRLIQGDPTVQGMAIDWSDA